MDTVDSNYPRNGHKVFSERVKFEMDGTNTDWGSAEHTQVQAV
jgi:hypothetical protein